MKKFLILIVLVFVGVLAWRVADDISHDAVIMSIGVLFGVLAGVPAALLVVASQRRQNAETTPVQRNDYQRPQQPVIVLAGNPQQAQGYQQPYHQGHQAQLPQWPTGGGNFQTMPPAQDTRFTGDGWQ